MKNTQQLLPVPQQNPPYTNKSNAYTHTHKRKLGHYTVFVSHWIGISLAIQLLGFFPYLKDFSVHILSAFPFRELSRFPECRELGKREKEKSPF